MIVTEPIDAWPYPDTPRRANPQFRARYDHTLKQLTYELEQLGTRGPAVIQVVTRNGADDLRRDGALRAHAKIEHPGVRLSFESKHGPLTYATDQFESSWATNMPDWQANLRAITLGLEALRAVDRYGISRSGEQYTGWLAIAGATSMTPAAAMQVLRDSAPDSKADEPLDKLMRWAKAGAHPDRHDGDRAPWDRVEEAIQALEGRIQ